MSTGYQIFDQFGTYFLTLTVVEWVDIFSRRIYRDIVMDSLDHCIKEQGLRVYGYVIMTNHVHLIARSDTGKLSDTIGNMKKYTSRKILETINSEAESRGEWLLHRFAWNAAHHQRNSQHQVWTHENHAVSIHSEAFFHQKLAYIHANPVRAGWVERDEDYIYSSARALYNNVAGRLVLDVW